MIHRAYRLSYTPTFLNLDYPITLVNSSINKFLHDIDNIDAPKSASNDTPSIMVPLPLIDQQSTNSVKRQMQNLSANIGVHIKPVFQSKKTRSDREEAPYC